MSLLIEHVIIYHIGGNLKNGKQFAVFLVEKEGFTCKKQLLKIFFNILKLETQAFGRHNYHYADLVLFMLLPNFKIYIVKKQNHLAAFNLVKFSKSFSYAHILLLAVDTANRRQHLATKLLKYVIDLSSIKQIVLEVRKDNLVAQNLYKSLCFKAIKTKHNFYKHPKCDALVMQRKI